jgi:peptidoglycan hydrolase CwlO-like protein
MKDNTKFALFISFISLIGFIIINVISLNRVYNIETNISDLQVQITELQEDSANQEEQIDNQEEQIILLSKFAITTAEIFKEQQKINESLLKGKQYGM